MTDNYFLVSLNYNFSFFFPLEGCLLRTEHRQRFVQTQDPIIHYQKALYVLNDF